MIMRRVKYIVLIHVMTIMTVSCMNTNLHSSVSVASEFNSVLEYYRNDDQKYAAARYLLDGLVCHESYEVEGYSDYCRAINSLFSLNHDESRLKTEAWKIVRKYADKVCLKPDAEMLSTEYLIRHIDSSFDQWKSIPTLRHLNFQEFCEYVLPYKCVEGQMIDNWKEYSSIEWDDDTLLWRQIGLYANSTRHAYMRIHDHLLENTNAKSFSHLDIIPVLVPEVILNAPYADCYEKAILELMYCRANGIPASVDYLPNWMDREGVHYWINILNATRVSESFEPLDPNDAYPGYFRKNDYRMPKVYRFVWKPHAVLKQAQDDGYLLPPSLAYIFVKDVTSDYCRTIDLSLRTTSDSRYQYLAVFDNYNWVPVDVSMNRKGKLTFSNVGVGGTYCIVTYDNGIVEQSGFPFEVTIDGQLHFFEYDPEAVADVRMSRKFPMSAGVYEARKYLRGGVVLGIEDLDVGLADTLCCFPDDYCLTGSCYIECHESYRYYALTFGDADACDIAELYFYDSHGNRVRPDILNPKDGKPWYVAPLRMIDEEPLTFSRIEKGKDNDKVLFDFGSPVSLSKVLYCRRGDGNDIIPGDIYELYYNNGKSWVLHERVVADDVSVGFHNVPEGGLLYVKCLNRGRQNRIFTYCAGVVQWH